ncbi:hypothetical protein BJF78_26535 [Pseudonocardia sp. CNS-139]|nr:hypothetical protein BJF78_26535 [Pseudonocardia sp. CNS-139]
MSPLLAEPTVTGTTVLVPVQNPTPPPGQGEEFGKASPVALVVIILLAVVTVFLIRGMSKRIRRLPATFEKEPAGADAGKDGKQPPGAGDAGSGPS